MPSKDNSVKSLSWFFRAAIPIVEGICENPRDVVLVTFRDATVSNSLPVLDTVFFPDPAASDGNVVCGFIRGGSNLIVERPVREWLPGPDSSGIYFEWTPIHGCFEKHELIKTIFSEIASDLTTRIDYIETAKKPKKRMGRPRLMNDGFSLNQVPPRTHQ